MIVLLNEDIFVLIYSYVFDFEALCATATAVAVERHHPLRNIILRRVLQLPLRLSSEKLDDSKALIDHLVHKPAHANLVRDLAIVLGISRKAIAERERYHIGRVNPRCFEELERAEVLAPLLPGLLRCTENLQRLDWSKSPPPSEEALDELSKRSRMVHLSLDCSVDSMLFPDPSDQLEAPNATAE